MHETIKQKIAQITKEKIENKIFPEFATMHELIKAMPQTEPNRISVGVSALVQMGHLEKGNTLNSEWLKIK